MCRVLKVHRSGYYAWKHTPVSDRGVEDAALLVAIKQSFEESHGICSPRIYRDLRAAGLNCSENRVARLMRRARLKSVRGYRKPRFKAGNRRWQPPTDYSGNSRSNKLTPPG
jgi:putative transposase